MVQQEWLLKDQYNSKYLWIKTVNSQYLVLIFTPASEIAKT